MPFFLVESRQKSTTLSAWLRVHDVSQQFIMVFCQEVLHSLVWWLTGNRNLQSNQQKNKKLIQNWSCHLFFTPPTRPGQSCSATAGRTSSCWSVRGTRSRCWTSCRVFITAWLRTPGVIRPLCSPACAPSSGRSRGRSCGWSLTYGEAEDRTEKDKHKQYNVKNYCEIYKLLVTYFNCIHSSNFCTVKYLYSTGLFTVIVVCLQWWIPPIYLVTLLVFQLYRGVCSMLQAFSDRRNHFIVLGT